jgi:hypothetical protein
VSWAGDAWIDASGPRLASDPGAAARDSAHGRRAAVGAVGERVRGQSGRANQEGSVALHLPLPPALCAETGETQGEEGEGRGFGHWSRVRPEVVDVQQKGRLIRELQ